jgi:hypothetical protein
MEDDNLWDNPDLDCLGSKTDSEESVNCDCETGLTSKKTVNR